MDEAKQVSLIGIDDDDRELYSDFYVDPETLTTRFSKHWSFFRNNALDLPRLSEFSKSWGLQDTPAAPCIRQQTESTNKSSGCNFLIANYIQSRIIFKVRIDMVMDELKRQNIIAINPTTGDEEIKDEKKADEINSSISMNDAYHSVSAEWAFDPKKQFKFYTKVIHEEFPFSETKSQVKTLYSVYFNGVQAFRPREGLTLHEVWSVWRRWASKEHYKKVDGKDELIRPKLMYSTKKQAKEFLFNKNNWSGSVKQIIKFTTAVTELSRTAYDRKVAYIAKTAILIANKYIKLKIEENTELTKKYNLPTEKEFSNYDQLVKTYSEEFLNDSICKRCLKPFNFDIKCYKIKNHYDRTPLKEYVEKFIKPKLYKFWDDNPDFTEHENKDVAYWVLKNVLTGTHFKNYVKEKDLMSKPSKTEWQGTTSIREIEKIYKEQFPDKKYSQDNIDKIKSAYNYFKDEEDTQKEVTILPQKKVNLDKLKIPIATKTKTRILKKKLN